MADDRSVELIGSAALTWIVADRPVTADDVQEHVGDDARQALTDLEAEGWLTRSAP